MIRLENVSFGYRRGNSVLDGFSLEIEDGGRICLFGRSGCGKSTVLRLAMGLSKPSAGSITGTEGLSVSAVFQEDRLIPWKTTLENVALFAGAPSGKSQDPQLRAAVEKAPAAQLHVPEMTAEETAAAYLCALGLGDVLQSFPDELSGGMKRRVALARALSHPFDLLVLDEPFTGLDDAAKRDAIALIDREAEGKMILIATHVLEEAELLGARVVKM